MKPADISLDNHSSWLGLQKDIFSTTAVAVLPAARGGPKWGRKLKTTFRNKNDTSLSHLFTDTFVKSRVATPKGAGGPDLAAADAPGSSVGVQERGGAKTQSHRSGVTANTEVTHGNLSEPPTHSTQRPVPQIITVPHTEPIPTHLFWSPATLYE